MSALLNHNARRAVSWKGKTLNQVTSVMQKNTPVAGNNIFLSPPLKIYRKEIAVNTPNTNAPYTSRISASIDELSRPGGSIITAKTSLAGAVGVEQNPTPPIKHTSYGCASDAASANCAATNARRRCRSSGMVRKTYDPSRGDSAYFTNSNQYLVSRSKTFTQNQYSHVRHADVSVVTDPLAVVASYSPNGISHCPKVELVAGANQFFYYWLDASGVGSTQYTVTIPPGFYDVHELNAVFESAMEANHHYYVYTPSRQHVFLMKIIYNASESRIELQCFSTTSVADRDIYAEPLIASWTTPEGDHVPVFYIPNSGIQTILGFSAGYYPDILADSAANQRASSYGILSEFPAKLQPSYAIVTYKPNNARFATQGAVSSGDLVVRRKYETISRNALGFANTYGAQMGAAMAYGQSIERYTIKDKIGFPNTRTPIFPKWSPNEMQCAEHGRVVGVCSSA